jgi:iron complex outermembrane receptor protein
MKRPAPLACLCALAIAPVTAGLAQEKTPAGPSSLEAPTVEVIAETPLPGLGVPRNQIPANVQAATDEDMQRVESLNLPDFMERALPSVNVNGIQGNPFQVDVNYRGFNASPRLGVPQGLSVYLDGVRINEPLGDIVNWDLVPQSAIANVNLVPGSNPLFGLNTLGGALSLRTKSGEKFPGTRAELAGGSFGGKSAALEHGGSRGEFGAYVSANWYDEDGWRDFAPSRLANFFGKIGREAADYDIDLSVLVADNRLIGNQVTPNRLMNARW